METPYEYLTNAYLNATLVWGEKCILTSFKQSGPLTFCCTLSGHNIPEIEIQSFKQIDKDVRMRPSYQVEITQKNMAYVASLINESEFLQIIKTGDISSLVSIETKYGRPGRPIIPS